MTTKKWNLLRLAPSLTVLAVLVGGCGGGGSSDPPTGPSSGPPATVFNSLSVTPTEAVMCLVDAGNTVALNATPRDQNGQALASLGAPTFTSSNDSAATVTPDGQVKAVAAGTALVTVALTAAGTTRTTTASITVARAVAGDAAGSVHANHPLPHIGAVTAAQLGAGNAVSLDIQGQAFHAHMLNLTATQVRLIAAGCQVSQASSINPHSDGSGAHFHNVSFN